MRWVSSGESCDQHSQKIGTQKSWRLGQFGEWGTSASCCASKIRCLAPLATTAAFLRLETSFALQHLGEQVDYECQLVVIKPGRMFPQHIPTPITTVKLMTLMQREMADDNRHLRSMESLYQLRAMQACG